MKIVIAPDSFKGSVSSIQVASAIERGIKKVMPNCETTCVPMADGGEGTVEAILAITGGEAIRAEVKDPLGRPVEAVFGWIKHRKTAVIEVAAASGLPLLAKDELNPHDASTFGTGELVKKALDLGAKEILIGLGGSATVDAGTGLLQALGIRFLNKAGEAIEMCGGELRNVEKMDTSGLDSRLQDVKFVIASDVMNPLLGEEGAVRVFGGQKGVKEAEMPSFENGMERYANLVVEVTGTDHRLSRGAGAAGGIGFSLLSFLNAQLQSGFTIISELANLKELIRSAQLVMTGEGKMDNQTMYGKVPSGVAKMAKELDIPVCAFTGKFEGDLEYFEQFGIPIVVPIVDEPMDLDAAMKNGEELLERAAERLLLWGHTLRKVIW